MRHIFFLLNKISENPIVSMLSRNIGNIFWILVIIFSIVLLLPGILSSIVFVQPSSVSTPIVVNPQTMVTYKLCDVQSTEFSFILSDDGVSWLNNEFNTFIRFDNNIWIDMSSKKSIFIPTGETVTVIAIPISDKYERLEREIDMPCTSSLFSSIPVVRRSAITVTDYNMEYYRSK